MTSSADQAPLDPVPRLSARQVEAWLRRHPGFLDDHPELLQHLTPPGRQTGEGVVDMQRYMLERLQRDVARLRDTQSALIAASRINMSTQAQVHAAVLALLDATTFEHLIHIVTADFAQLLDVDVVTLCVENTDTPQRRISTSNVYLLPRGTVDRLVGESHDVLLRTTPPPDELVFGPAARLVHSDALVRLRFNAVAPTGLLALGARQPDKFHPGQGTELLQFLARTLESCVRGWLDLPSP